MLLLGLGGCHRATPTRHPSPWLAGSSTGPRWDCPRKRTLTPGRIAVRAARGVVQGGMWGGRRGGPTASVLVRVMVRVLGWEGQVWVGRAGSEEQRQGARQGGMEREMGQRSWGANGAYSSP